MNNILSSIMILALAGCSPDRASPVESPTIIVLPEDLSSAIGPRPEIRILGSGASAHAQQPRAEDFVLRAPNGDLIPFEFIRAPSLSDDPLAHNREFDVTLRPSVDLPSGWTSLTLSLPDYDVHPWFQPGGEGFRLNADSSPVLVRSIHESHRSGGRHYMLRFSEPVGLRSNAAEPAAPVVFLDASMTPLDCASVVPYTNSDVATQALAGPARSLWTYVCPTIAEHVSLNGDFVSQADGTRVRGYGDESDEDVSVIAIGRSEHWYQW